MKRLLALTSILLFLLGISFFPSLVGAREREEFASDRLIIKFKETTPVLERERVRRDLRTELAAKIDKLDVEVVKVPRGRTAEFLEKFGRLANIEYVEPDFVAEALELTSDPSLSLQWGMFKIKAADAGASAWDTAKSDPSVKIAILDTGIDEDHEDLAGKVVASNNCTDSSTLDDVYGHGTHVAGIAAASTNNALGVAGVGYNTSLMNVKVLGDNGSGYYSWVANCLVWAADNGARVVNMSLGGSSSSKTLESAVNYAWNKGVVLAGAAGNSGSSRRLYPAYYKNVIAVAATDQNDKKTSWSNYGSWVDVAAPGLDIYSTWKGNSYKSISGTSMATPHVAGLAALVWPTTYGGSNGNVRKQIEATADKITGTGRYWTYGRINALNAVSVAGAYATRTSSR